MMKRETKGFTLTELMIVTFIELVIIIIMVQVVISLNQNYKIVTSYLYSYLRGREAIDIISKDCRTAIRVMDSYSGYTATNSCLVLKVPSIDGSGNIIDVNREFDYIIYFISGQDLWKRVIPGSVSSRTLRNSVFKKSIQSLYMEKDGTPLSGITHKSSITHLTIWLSISENILGRTYGVQPGTTVKFMNYEWGFVR